MRYSPGSTCDGLRAFDRLGQFLEFGGEDLQFGGERRSSPGIASAGVEQGFEHHRDARQDRFLDPLERLVETRLGFHVPMAPAMDNLG